MAGSIGEAELWAGAQPPAVGQSGPGGRGLEDPRSDRRGYRVIYQMEEKRLLVLMVIEGHRRLRGLPSG
jgi:hypothetical protein